MGYLNNSEATRETKDADGFVHTGDQGYLDADGFLHVVGRFKEMIFTSTGENVAPGKIE